VTPSFEAPDLARRVEAMNEQQRDALPFGVIRLDAGGVVRIYSRTEAALSGRKRRPTIGLDFFAEVAPCMASPEMRGRVEAAKTRGSVDVEIGWIGDFADAEGEIRIRVMSAADGGLWLFMHRDAA